MTHRKANPPAVPGWYADPYLTIFDDRYYLYPTTDGVEGWASQSFKVFSSNDLFDWTDHGAILDLPRDTTWATGHAWAPAIARRDGRYFLYYTADQSIGVAVGTSPTGPFTDLGRPLIRSDEYPGVAIDPSIFEDGDGTFYLYWGNTVAHGVPLNEDMVSFDRGRVVSFEPPGFREAAAVHRRGGIYYLTWSENDTREEDYRVRYATSTGPLGPWADHGVLLAKQPHRGILATGHHSIVRLPDADEWLIAYHRFAIPDGNGYRREVVIDRLVHRPDGRLEPVEPSTAPLIVRLPASELP